MATEVMLPEALRAISWAGTEALPPLHQTVKAGLCGCSGDSWLGWAGLGLAGRAGAGCCTIYDKNWARPDSYGAQAYKNRSGHGSQGPP